MRPGAASAAVTHPLPRPPSPPSPSASSEPGRRCRESSSASSTSSSASLLASSRSESGVEELDIVFLPGDADPLSFPAAQGWIVLRADLGEHPLVAGQQVELHEITEELDEHDLALRRVEPVPRAVRLDRHRRRANGDHRRAADRAPVAGGVDADAEVLLVAFDDQPVALVRLDDAAEDVVVA